MRLKRSRSGAAHAVNPPPPVALDFPRADGPARTGTAQAAPLLPPGLPVAHFSVASVVLGILVIVTVWSLGASFFVNHLGLRHALENKQLDRAVRAAVTVEAALAADARELETGVRALADDAQLLGALAADAGAQRSVQLAAAVKAGRRDTGGRIRRRPGCAAADGATFDQ